MSSHSRKRPREDPDLQRPCDAGPTIEGSPQSAERRNRGFTACQGCRGRKSKCDNVRPSCSACVRHGGQCVYDGGQDISLFQGVVPQLFDAITNLTRLLEDKIPQIEATSPQLNPHISASPGGETSTSYTRAADGILPNDEKTRLRFLPGGGCGLDSVLTWAPFLSVSQDFPKPLGLCGPDRKATRELPSLDLSTLLRLEAKYLKAVHTKNPIVDPIELHQTFLDLAENGFDWSPKSCLIALICALGAIVGQCSSTAEFPDSESTLTSEPELALRFFDVAAKRIGYSIFQNDIRAVQCACLAGIWYMCNIQPITAWRFFSLAGNTWCTASSLCPLPLNTQELQYHEAGLVLQRHLYFTIFRSECELRMELRLPGSSLEDMELASSFPQPPSLDKLPADQQSDTTVRSWYYILAELAVRHLLNRLLRYSALDLGSVVDEQSISQMIKDAELFMAQLEDWYRLLPSVYQFQQPRDLDLDPEPDELRFILRYRYLSCRDLTTRPFLKLCVSQPLDSIDSGLLERVAGLANTCLHTCMLKLTQIRVERHQGTWFMMRNQTANAAILLSAAIARADSKLKGAVRLDLPHGWRDRISAMMDLVGPFWGDTTGRLSHMKAFLEQTLARTV